MREVRAARRPPLVRRAVHAAIGLAVTGIAVATTGVGAAWAVPTLSVAPATINFTTQLTGTTSLAQNLLVSNSGTTALTVSSVTVGGLNATDFAATNGCTTPVAAAGACLVSITFSPSAAGDRSGTVTIASDGGTSTVPLTGTALAASPVLTAQPGVVTFPGVTVGTTSGPLAETVSNTGSAPLVLGAITLGGANGADYSVVNGCPASIAPGASCPLTLRLTPSAPGNRTGTMTIASNGGTVTVTMTGSGVPVAAPVLSTPTSATFAAQSMGRTSAAQNVTVTNTGNAPLSVTGATLAGTNPADFTLTNGCTAAVAPGGTCTIAVLHTPQAVGARSSTLTVASNGGTRTVALGGTGTIAGSCPTNPSGWYGQYFANSTLSGTPGICRNDAAVNFTWLVLPPVGLLMGNFSARWTRTATFATTRTYTFTATSSDGMRLYVDGNLVINAWSDVLFTTTRTANVALTAGTHTIVYEYYNHDLLSASAALTWS